MRHKSKRPWESVAKSLKDKGLSYPEIAAVLSHQGYKSFRGKKITENTVRNRFWYKSKYLSD